MLAAVSSDDDDDDDEFYDDLPRLPPGASQTASFELVIRSDIHGRSATTVPSGLFSSSSALDTELPAPPPGCETLAPPTEGSGRFYCSKVSDMYPRPDVAFREFDDDGNKKYTYCVTGDAAWGDTTQDEVAQRQQLFCCILGGYARLLANFFDANVSTTLPKVLQLTALIGRKRQRRSG